MATTEAMHARPEETVRNVAALAAAAQARADEDVKLKAAYEDWKQCISLTACDNAAANTAAEAASASASTKAPEVV